MAYVTAIRDDEQVEYRLREQAGCSVVVSEDVVQEQADRALEYRLREEGEAALVWMGSGLAAVGLTEGAVLDEAGKDAARRLMAGCHPETGARLIRTQTSVRAHPLAKLTTARLVEAIEAAAEERGVAAADLLEGKPKQQRVLAQQQRMVHFKGDRHRMQVGTLHKLARAAGLDLADVYGEQELAEAREHANARVDDRVRGWDLMLDLPKSDSALAGLLPDVDGQEYRDLVHRAKTETIREVERWVGYAVGSEDGQPVRLATGGLLAWSVEHQSARPMGDGQPGDPHLHLHITIANMALCEDGKWRSIGNSGQDLHRHAAAADAFFKARVRALAHERYGVRREQAERTGAWEVEGVPEAVRDLYSRRHRRIVEMAGDESGRQERDRAAAESLRAKHAADAAGMRASWRQRAEEAGVDVDAMVAAAAPGPPDPGAGPVLDGPGGPRIPPPSDLAAVVFHPETGLTASNKTFSRAQLLAAVGNALPYGLDADVPGRLDQLADEVLSVAGYAVRAPDYGSTVMTSTARYTTQDILDAEAYVRDQALTRFGEDSASLTGDQAAAAVDVFEVAVGFELSPEQRAAVTRLLTGGHGIDTVVGVAGAGKSTLMEACRIGWDATGTTYAGACLSAVAAQQLTQASGIPARTVASWLQQIRTGTGLTGVDVLVIDEATMVDDRAAEVLMREAARTGTKLIGIGDPLQLQAVGVGGWFREVHRIVGGLTLTENRRQEDAAERHALEVWRTGDHDQALRLLAERGRVHPTESADEARSQILTVWDQLRRDRWPDTHDLLDELVVLAARNSDVDALNLGAQQIRRAAGELGTERTYALPGGDRLTLAEGDAVRVRANDYRSRRGEGPDLLNGYRAVVSEIADDGRVEVTWRTRERGQNDAYLSAWLTPEQIAGGALSLGYAMTIAASQGMTCDTSLLYGHGANAHAAYPGLTRGKKANHIWLPLQVIESEDTQARLGAARTEKERLERAVDAYARFLGQSRPDSMVSDLFHEPPAPAEVIVPSPTDTRAVSSAAARARSPRHVQQREEEATAPREYRLTDEQKRHLEEMREERELAGTRAWNQRPYGGHTDQELIRLIATGPVDARREDRDADSADEAAAALLQEIEDAAAGGTTPGRIEVEPIYAVLDQADEHLAVARSEQARETAAAKVAATADEHLRVLSLSDDKSRLALRLAGTSLKEHKELKKQAEADRAAGRREGADARMAAGRAAADAWKTVRESPYASVLGATEHRAPDVDTLAARLTEMRQVRLPARAQQKDAGDQKRIARFNATASKSREAASMYRAVADDARTEKALRQQIAQQHPELHRAETRARAEVQQAQQAQTARIEQQNRRYQPPAPSRSGPKRGR
ncbi:MobF family relaxase [Streptomyces cyaneofuscatus]|uniref:AAA family ATPase n=1 Tax=Streptomyces cyaneofuscatus TaxID=66883 RepID=A0ABZ1F8R9_9ACTN|nr:MobF family relaxase [Streptomyces cyaneofuscatus]WSB12614.1 AAA family ATPase [Streptomyces cyaneofuscatus]WSD51170.1 AAA family ATPase [Streptomyces cyaneofuscatus]WSD51201.1 AAA family ATPase [Streptomyces cyaneofuscatus]